MNKLVIVAVTLLVIVLLGLPGLVGSSIETRVYERVAAIDASPSGAAEVVSFERGWFRSKARIELRLVADAVARLPVAADGAAPTSLPVAIEFAHGPIAVLDGVHFGWSKIVARPDKEAAGVTELEQTLGVPHLFEFRGRSSYLGSIAFDADAPPFELPIDEALLTFSGATLVGTFADRRLDADAQINSVQFTSASGAVAVRGVFVSADNELRSRYVLPGTSALTVESITVSDSAQGAMPVFEAERLSFTSEVALDAADELLEMRINYDVSALRIDENRFSSAALGMQLRNIDVAAFEAYAATAEDAADDGDAGAAIAALGPHLERALRAEPSATFEPLRFRYDDEPFEGRVEITTNAARLPPAGTFALDNALLLLGLVNVDADLRLSKPLAGELATVASRLQLGADDSIPADQLDYMAEAQSGLMVAMLVGQGMLVEEGNDYRCTVQYRDGSVTINGNPLPFGP